MANIIPYALNATEPVTAEDFTEADSLVLSALSYLQFPQKSGAATWQGVRLHDLFRAEYFAELQGELHEDYIHLLAVCACSRRFRNIRVCGYRSQTDAEREQQFAAVSYRLSPTLGYVAFRGTDSSFIGWREDFNLALEAPVPSQAEAADYLEEAASHLPEQLMAGGHSKGGNLAVYAAATVSRVIRGRLCGVYSHDGPGFRSDTLAAPGFAEIRPIIHKSIPQGSIVGLLLSQDADYHIIRSNGKGFGQHNPFTWRVEGCSFDAMDEITVEAKLINGAIRGWLDSLSRTEYRQFIDTFFGLLESTEATTFNDIQLHRRALVPVILKAASALPLESRQFLRRQLYELASGGMRELHEILRSYEILHR